MKTDFENRLDSILSGDPDQSTQELLDQLDDEGPVNRRLPDVVYQPVESEQATELPKDIASDYELSRTVLRGMIERGQSALEGAMILAAESENTKSYTVVAELIRTLTDTTSRLLEIHTTVKKPSTTGKTVIEKQVNVQNNFNTTDNDQVSESKSLDKLLDALDDN